MRAAILTLTFASLATRPASAEVVGDAVAGVAGRAASPQLGVRAGLETDALGALVSADWTYVRGFNTVDAYEYRDRFRALASGVLPFHLGRDTKMSIRLGAGIELARLTQRGTFPVNLPHMTTHDRDLGMTYEGALGVLFDVGGFAWGGEVGLAISLHDAPEITDNEDQRNELFVRLVGRFSR
ncbi:MAG: hypothetical protein HOV81_37015 [Kofleriaceae bacterium]|nr:hypothetical protein [Kofleriaceae bacterium]